MKTILLLQETEQLLFVTVAADSACLKKKIHRYRINYSTANIFIACFVQIEILKSVIHNVHQGITHSIYSYLSQQMNCNF